jgi:polyisoprenoid-binding protein YceI
MSNITTEKTAPTGTWSADPVHSHVSFEVAYAGTNTFRGGFREYAATLEASVDRNAFGVSWNAPNQGGGNYLGDDVTIKADLALVKAERQEG